MYINNYHSVVGKVWILSSTNLGFSTYKMYDLGQVHLNTGSHLLHL